MSTPLKVRAFKRTSDLTRPFEPVLTHNLRRAVYHLGKHLFMDFSELCGLCIGGIV